MTRKQLENINKPIYILSQSHTTMLHPDDLIGENYGIYGWNWKAYELYDYIIVTGNRNFPKNAIPIDYNLSGKYDKLVETYKNDHSNRRHKVVCYMYEQLSNLISETTK